MTNQLNLMSQAVTNSDGNSFDNALSALNTDLDDSSRRRPGIPFSSPTVRPNSRMPASRIQSSATYDLSTPSGQAAATADVTTLSNTLQTIITVNGANQTVAASQLTALNGQINSLQNLQYQQQTAASQAVAQQTAQLQQNMQNQLHLIQLNLGKSSQLATALSAALNPPQPINSVFGALMNSVGQTALERRNAARQQPGHPVALRLGSGDCPRVDQARPLPPAV